MTWQTLPNQSKPHVKWTGVNERSSHAGCAAPTTGNGIAPKAARNEPTPVSDVGTSTPHGASRKVPEGFVAYRANNYGCARTKGRRLGGQKDTWSTSRSFLPP